MDVIKTTLTALLVDAEAAINECSLPVAQIGIVPGSTVAWDNPCDGQIWARVIDVTPVMQSRSCDIDYIGVTAALGIVRCWSGTDDDGIPPTSAEMDADAERMLKDADALLTALVGKGYTVSRGVPLGPSGYSGGWEWTFTFKKTPCVGC